MAWVGCTAHTHGAQAHRPSRQPTAGTAQAGGAQAGTAQAGSAQAGGAQAGSAQAGTAQAGSAQADSAQAGSRSGPYATKYLAWGWGLMMASVVCSGCIWNPSLTVTPMRCASRSSTTLALSSRSGQAGYPHE